MTRLAPFAIHRATSIEEASALIAEHGDGASFYAGGTELLQVMKMGLAPVSTLIDLKGIPGLSGISTTDDGALRIGGTATHRTIERSPLVARELPGLIRLERHLANVRVRNAGRNPTMNPIPHVVCMVASTMGSHARARRGRPRLSIRPAITTPTA